MKVEGVGRLHTVKVVRYMAQGGPVTGCMVLVDDGVPYD